MKKDEEQKSGEIVLHTKKGPVKMFLTHHAPDAAKKWWMPLAIAILGAFQAFGTSGVLSKPEVDARDTDMVKMQKSNEALWRTVGPLAQRVSYLEGLLRVRAPSEPQTLPSDIKVDKTDVENYQRERK